MKHPIKPSFRRLLLAAALAVTTLSAAAQTGGTAATVPPKGPPADFVVPADPKPGDSNAERSKSQPGNNAPMWRAVRESGNTPGISNLPGAEMGVLIQPFVQYPGSRLSTAGEAWRQVRNQWILPYGSALLAIMLAALALYYWRRGSIGGHVPDTGHVIERFTYVERAAHWSVAISFVLLAFSGLVMAYGKFFLLPIIGGNLFGVLTYGLKTGHNFVGPVFSVALLILVGTFVRDNLPSASDLKWLAGAGGLFGGKEAPSHRFNAGEKIVFWGGVMGLGLTVIASGLVLDKLVPGLAYLRTDMQLAQMIHGVASLLMMTMFIAHIYLGTIGMKGAFKGMSTGYVDEAWGREHHELWYDDIKAGKIAAQRTAETPPGTLVVSGPGA